MGSIECIYGGYTYYKPSECAQNLRQTPIKWAFCSFLHKLKRVMHPNLRQNLIFTLNPTRIKWHKMKRILERNNG